MALATTLMKLMSINLEKHNKMKTINDYKDSFRNLAEQCKKELGADHIRVCVYEQNSLLHEETDIKVEMEFS